MLFAAHGQIAQPPAQRVIDDILKACVTTSAQSFERDGHIVVQRQSRSHTSIHKAFDALISMSETVTNRSGGMSRTPPRFRRLPAFQHIISTSFRKIKTRRGSPESPRFGSTKRGGCNRGQGQG
jgi:hypothetical protein